MATRASARESALAEISRSLFENVQDGVVVLDQDGYILNMNPAGCQRLGYRLEEIRGKHMSALCAPEYAAKSAERVRQLGTGEFAVFESANVRKDGGIGPVEVNARALEVGDEKFILATVRDISGRKETERQLLATQESMSAVLEAIPDLLFEVGLDGRYYDLRAHDKSLLAAPPATLLGKRIADVLPAEAAAICLQALQEANRSGYTSGQQIVLELNGERKWFELSVARKREVDATGPHFIILSRDITGRKQAEAAAIEKESAYRVAIETTPDGFWMADMQGRLLEANEAYVRLSGYSREELLGMTISQLDANHDAAEVARRIGEIIDTGGHARFETTHRRKDGSLWPVQIITTHSALGEGRFFVFITDLTERKQAETRARRMQQYLQLQIDRMPIACILWDPDFRAQAWNPAAAAMFGYDGEEMLGRQPHGLIVPPEAWPAVEQEWRRLLHDGASTRSISENTTRDGRTIICEWTNTLLPEMEGRPASVLSMVQDITARRTAEEEMRLARLVYDNSSEAILVSDARNRIIAVNPAFVRMTGFSPEEVLGQTPSLFKSGRHDRAFYEAMWQELNASGQWHGEIWDRRKDGSTHVKLLTINTIRDEHGAVYRYVALFTDITERKRNEELIWQQANFDQLTELPNRHMFHDRLEQDARKAHRAGLPLALMLIDLDRFKDVNDTLGHVLGDRLLIDAAARIKSCVRESDTVARLGGDEFAIILTEVTDSAGIEHIAQHIIARLAEPFRLGTQQAYISASIGISLYPNDTQDLTDLLKNADQAMYAAKSAGRNRFHYYTPGMQDAALKRAQLANDLRTALIAGQFRVYYQPIVDLASGHVYKAEALVRWQHPERGMIGPAEFIPLAEETGLIVPIGDWVFREAARQAASWRAARHPEFQVSVNKSPVQLRHDGGGRDAWLEYLAEQGLPGQAIVVEITESLMLNTEERVNEKLLKFRDAGIQVSIDDFGTGYSSLAYLKKFDIDYLKIDQSFVRNLETDGDDFALSEAIIVLAHKLGLKVIAEGVETETQRAVLRGMGCDYAQGYYFARPLPADEFEQFLDQWQPAAR